MQHNAYLGDCLCVVCGARPDEVVTDHLQVPFVLLLLKSKDDLRTISTIQDLLTASVFAEDSPILLRASSECLFGLFGDSHCDCEPQRIACLREIQRHGQGV